MTEKKSDKKKPPLWEFFDALSKSKRDLIATGEASIESYVPFMITRAFSRHPDCVLAAGEINSLGDVDKIMHYDYWMHTARSTFRKGGKWEEQVKDHVVEVIMELYGCNRTRAAEIVWTIGREAAEKIVEKYENELGGR